MINWEENRTPGGAAVPDGDRDRRREPFTRRSIAYGAGDVYDERGWELKPGPFTGLGPRNYRRSDESILEDVSERLSLHGRLDASNITVEVVNGEVTLSGTVGGRWAKREAGMTAEAVRGVLDVHNRLKIRETRRTGTDYPLEEEGSSEGFSDGSSEGRSEGRDEP